LGENSSGSFLRRVEMRVKAVISYNGNLFYGFQKQKETNQTVTNRVEDALKKININSDIIGSGRTDRGVHATGQVIDFEVPKYWSDLKKLKTSLNRILEGVKIKHIIKVDDKFHSRFSAKKRVYRYVFKTTKLSLFEEDFISYYNSFDMDKLQDGLDILIGTHDFGFLIKQGSYTHTNIRTIYQAFYKQRKNYHFIYFTANGFLRAQVRMMINLVMLYAQGKISRDDIVSQLNLKHRITTKLAPPQGLYLARVLY